MEFLQTTLGIILTAVIGFGIFSLILYFLIEGGGRGRKVWVEAQKQTQLLAEMAKKQGIPQGTIDEILDDDQYKKSDMF